MIKHIIIEYYIFIVFKLEYYVVGTFVFSNICKSIALNVLKLIRLSVLK